VLTKAPPQYFCKKQTTNLKKHAIIKRYTFLCAQIKQHLKIIFNIKQVNTIIFMKSIFSLLFVTFICVSTSFAQCYQLVWADEFSGSSLDLTKWTPVLGQSYNGELQYYTDRTDNIQVSSGTLKIIAKAENYGGKAYTSGRMQTQNMGDWLYGRMEARIKIPITQGSWPAFWMLPTDNIYGIWPKSGEIDIMETVGREPTKNFASIHTSNDGTVQTYTTAYTLPSGTFADDFHVFTMEWAPNVIRFYVDGNLYATKTPATVSPYPWVFNKRFYFLLNLAIGGDWAGSPNGTSVFPQTMEVDYVRVYQKLSDLAITGRILVEPNTPSVNYAVPSISGTTYQWSVSGGGTIVSGQGTSQIVVNWGTASGTVSVLINDGCLPSATISTPVEVSGNTWSNPNFEQNFVNWETRPAYNSTATFSISTTDFSEGTRAACVQTNTAAPSTPWSIQLSRANLNLVAGTSYTLRFKAKADAARTIPIAFIRSSDFGGVAYKTINLTTSWQPFELIFTPSSSVNTMFNADLAGALGTYCFDEFVFGRTALLPVELLDFSGNTEGMGNVLRWQTANEINISHFDIERSFDGKAFEKIGEISAKGSNASYRFWDDKSAQRSGRFEISPTLILYYRLKINELNGSSFFSKTISLTKGKMQKVKIVSLSPNPTNGFLDIQLDNPKGEVATIEVFNTLGQLVFSEKIADWADKKRLNTEGWSSGVYFLKMSAGQTIETVRFLKK
jgi:beta-glucanase (GH16 family)